MRNTATSSSIPAQIRLTVDFDTPDSHPRARTRSSTFRVEVPVVYAVMITPHSALSTRRRGSSSDGKNDPTRTFGIRSSRSPVGVDNNRERLPLRWFIVGMLADADPTEKADLYRELGVTLRYDPSGTIAVQAPPRGVTIRVGGGT